MKLAYILLLATPLNGCADYSRERAQNNFPRTVSTDERAQAIELEMEVQEKILQSR